ncbi:MAG TPA: glycosyltransferase family 4 protein [Pyrinomonadaceae bacterium]|jgi:glycosyltransferase involved in cell wall biosynthesis
MIVTLQTSTFGAYGGIPTYNRLVCRVLNDFGEVGAHHVLLATDKPENVEPWKSKLSGLQLEAYARNRTAFVRRVVGLAASQRIDLALIGHVNYAPLGLLLRRLQPQLRYGVMMYGIDVWTPLSKLRRQALRRADFAVSISEYTKRMAVEANGIEAGRVRLLPNALEWDEGEGLTTMPEPPAMAGPRLLTVTRLDETERYKGVDAVIKALPSVTARAPGVQYIVVGSGGDLPRLKGLAERLGVSGRVHFLGSVDDATLRAHYRACDVFVMPSAKEGFGFVFLEAMQYAKPVVAADAGGSPEVVLDGVTGSLVSYGDIDGLAQALSTLCLDPEKRARMGRAGYERLREHYTFPRFRRTLTDILLRELPSAAVYRARQSALAC